MRPVYRKIQKKNERQGKLRFDVLVCGHTVPVNDSTYENTYRQFRACPECLRRVADLRREMAARDKSQAAPSPRVYGRKAV